MQKKIFLYLLIFCGFLILLILTLNSILSRNANKSQYNGLNKIPYSNNSHGIEQSLWENYPYSISFIGTDNGIKYFLYSLDLVSGKSEKIISNFSVVRYVWNNDRSEVAFWGQNTETGNEGVFIFNTVKKSLREIDQIAGFPDSWSPDNKQLAINGECESPSRHACSFLFDNELSKKEVLSFNGETQPFINLSWSPDGKRIAFIYGDPFTDKSTYGLYVMDLQDHQTRMLVSGKQEGVRLLQPKWIREGEWLVYLREGPSSESELNFVNSEKTNCQINPLSKMNSIHSYDVFENTGNLFFLLIDSNKSIYTLDFKQALKPFTIEQVFQCSKE